MYRPYDLINPETDSYSCAHKSRVLPSTQRRVLDNGATRIAQVNNTARPMKRWIAESDKRKRKRVGGDLQFEAPIDLHTTVSSASPPTRSSRIPYRDSVGRTLHLHGRSWQFKSRN